MVASSLLRSLTGAVSAALRGSHLRLFALRVFPALAWLGELRKAQTLRADIIAGVTVALVLIPQSMAYAQLAGLPAYFGLYAAFLPPIVGALFGSSRQLATGPVAVVSLLTAAALEPLATAGGAAYIGYAVLLALMVGVFQLSLGLLRLGILVNFLSHPVVVGFTNAAAIIIAASQLDKLFGVSVPKSAHQYETVWNTVVAVANNSHLPTVMIAVIALALMIGVRRYSPKLPSVLIAVVVTTLLSWGLNFEMVRVAKLEQIANNTVYFLVTDQLTLKDELAGMDAEIADAVRHYDKVRTEFGEQDSRTLSGFQALDLLRFKKQRRIDRAAKDLGELKQIPLSYILRGERYYLKGHIPAQDKTDGETWGLVKINEADGSLTLSAGGRVIGNVPRGLPGFALPTFDLAALSQLISAAVAIALIGFMEAISIAKAMATRTRQRLDSNQELVGQGLANIVGSAFGSYAVSGSFSRSAVNIGAGARTGFSSVVTGLMVVATLLWFTPLLYYLPQATLAAVIMMAVIGLVNVRAIRHAWAVQWQDGFVAVLTFVLTLVFAPHLDRSIMIGVILSLILFLYRTMKPRVVVLSRHHDGLLRDADLYGLQRCENISLIRFDGSLYFANTSYFEDAVLDRLVDKPELKFVIVDAVGINQIDATGEEMLINLVHGLREQGIALLFTRLKMQVMNVLRRSGFVERIGEEFFFRRPENALDYAWAELGENHEVDCPLNVVCPVEKG